MFYMLFKHFINLPCLLLNHLLFWRKRLPWTKGLQIWGRLRFFGAGTLKLGRNVSITSSIDGNPTGGTFTAFVTYPGSCLSIGDYSGISNSTINVRKSIEIGEHVLIGAACLIADNDFHPVDYLVRRDHPLSEINVKPVKIGDDVFIGAHCIILKGVTIGARSIIGAGSVVTHDIPDDECWAGNPARFVKKLNHHEK